MTGLAGLILLGDLPSSAEADFPAFRAKNTPTPDSGGATLSPDTPSATSAIQADRWNTIVIHHSARMAGTVRELDARAKNAGLNGIGYHFVIGNGSGLSDGVVESGYRWRDQTAGAHVAISPGAGDAERRRANELNSNSIGICLIGNGNRQPFTESQIRSLIELVRTLQRQCDIPGSQVLLHSDVFVANDPGRFFPADRLETNIDP